MSNLAIRVISMVSWYVSLFITFSLHFCYINIACFFPIAPTPFIPFSPSLISFEMSCPLTNLLLSVVAIFSATISGSTKSIRILPGDDAKSAPASISASKKLWQAPAKITNLLELLAHFLASFTVFIKFFEFL